MTLGAGAAAHAPEGVISVKDLRALVTVALGLGLTVALLWTLRGLSVPALAGCDLAPTPPSLNRLPLAPKN